LTLRDIRSAEDAEARRTELLRNAEPHVFDQMRDEFATQSKDIVAKACALAKVTFSARQELMDDGRLCTIEVGSRHAESKCILQPFTKLVRTDPARDGGFAYEVVFGGAGSTQYITLDRPQVPVCVCDSTVSKRVAYLLWVSPQDNEKIARAIVAFFDEQSVQSELPVNAEEAKGSCFIATAAFRGANAPEVIALRSFRERRLRPFRYGRLVIRAYGILSPPLANLIRRSPALARMSRVVIRWLLKVSRVECDAA